MARWTGDDEGYASMARLHIANLEKALQSDRERLRTGGAMVEEAKQV